MPLLLNLLPARFLLTLREWFDYKISHCVIKIPGKISRPILILLCSSLYQKKAIMRRDRYGLCYRWLECWINLGGIK